MLSLINSCHVFQCFTVVDRLQVRWGRVGHKPTPMSGCQLILIVPYRLKILFFLETTMLHCFFIWRPIKPNPSPVATGTRRRRAGAVYLCIDTLVSIGTIISAFSFRSSQSKLFPSSPSSTSSSGIPLLSMSNARKSTKARDYPGRLVLTRSSSGVTGVELQGWSSLSPDKNLFFLCGRK